MNLRPKDIRDANYFEEGDGTFLCELYHPKNGDKDLPYSMAYAKLKPGSSSLKHELGQDELYIFTQGKGYISIEGEKIPIHSGQSIIVPRKKLQYLSNSGEEDLCFYCIVSPPWTEEEEKVQKE